MKTFYFTILIMVGFALSCVAQSNYYPLIHEDDDQQWNVLYVVEPYHYTWSTDIQFIEGDSIIDGIAYKQAWRKSSYGTGLRLKGFVREEDQRVYYRQIQPWALEEEVVLYDFNITLGDTVTIGGEYGVTLMVIEESEVEVDGTMRRQLGLGEPNNPFSDVYEYWIEGVGSSYGFLNSGSESVCGSTSYLLCYYENDGLIWDNEEFDDCVMNSNDAGTLAKINAPYFENNVNDYRFAIINWIDTCYVMVNGAWPNPNADELIVKYDTIPLGSEMDVTGTYHYMEDDNGNTFRVIDIQQYNNAIYSYSTGYLLSWSIDEIPHITDYYLNPKYYVAINGELQTEFPVTFNGLTLNIGDGIYTFVGIAETWPDYDLPILNLYDIIPYSSDLNINGIILPDDLCMTLPCEEDKYLSCIDGLQEFYLTNEGKLIEKSWFGPLWNDNTNSTIAGISGCVYDLYGNEVHTIEIREVESVGERTLNGQLEPTCYPPMGPYPPIGLDIAIVSDEFEYFIDNPHEDGFQPYCIIENDTLPFYQDITATISSSYMFVDGSNIKHFTVHLDNIEVVPEMFLIGTEWYYEITNDNGSVTYQYLECAADTTINDHPIHILVRINTLYDKSEVVTHEYIYEENNKVYWWNKTLGEFTTLYDFGAEVGDEWEIKVGTHTIPVHVDAAQTVTYKSQEYKMLSISDPDDIFTGDIICGIGHLTSFFPEKLMTKGYRVENIRCFWQDGELVYQNGDQDCDEIYEQHHLGVDEIDAENEFAVYPNPSYNVLYVLSDNINSEYRVTNLMGQTLMIGEITSENQMIAVSSLPKGIYFITINNASKIFVIK